MNYLIIGDVIEDVYVKGRIRGISAETPTMVMETESTEFSPGGAALVHSHLANLLWDRAGRFEDSAFQYYDTPIVTKKRFYVNGYKLFQVDEFHEFESMNEMDLRSAMMIADVVIIADNRHGLLTEPLARFIVDYCKANNKRLFVDSQVSQSKPNHEWYSGAETMLMNEVEFKALGGVYLGNLPLSEMCDKFSWKNLIVKRGSQGSVASINGKFISTCATKVDARDTCGAGDAFLASLVTNGDITTDTLKMANAYAARTCTYIGTRVR